MTAPSDGPAHEAERFPLIVFVHVPKTGGTTVGKALWICSHRGQGCCHRIPTLKVLDAARRNDWLGGHLRRDIFDTILLSLDRPIEYFANIREPISQLLSNLNFLFEIYNRGPIFFWACPHRQQLLSAETRATDFSKTSSIITHLLRYKGYFLNYQARMILGNDFATIPDSEAARRVAAYTFIAAHENLSALYPAFGFAQLPKQINELRENAAQKYYFDTALFQSQEIRDFLAQHHSHDFRLYDCVRQNSWPAEGRRPFRPAFPFVTADNYDEQAYLDFNPDVAKALKRHRTWRSGRDHFAAHGLAEQRRQLIMPRDEDDRQRTQALGFVRRQRI
ncbi:MAG: hypothetical protein L0Y60_09220 [Beijerinckiaceae bacterium]|nr:hypothetical protein [Beijerinckiaceae bacterium]